MAKDPDGNVVIFINGQHSGSGGTAAYWKGYDEKAMDKIGDHSARYVDGALGGVAKNTKDDAILGAIGGGAASSGTLGGIGKWIGSLVGAAIVVIKESNLKLDVRKAAGEKQGMADAKSIYDHLSEGETVKIVAHSMGVGFARGYVDGLEKWAKANGKEFKIEYELDVNAFEGKDCPANKNVLRTQCKTGGLDGGNSMSEIIKGNSVPSVAPVPDAENLSKIFPSDDANHGHDIGKMSDSHIPDIGNPGTESKKPIEQGSNNSNAPK
jgi:hypothetical protein